MISIIRNYINENRLFYGAVSAILLGNLIFLVLFVNPEKRRVKNLKKEYFLLRNEKAERTEEYRAKIDYFARIENARKDLASFLDLLPHQNEITHIISEIHKMAEKEKLSIKSAKYSSPKDYGTKLVRYSISFPLVGSYRQIRKFIYHLEKMPYLMSIDELNLASDNRFGGVSLSLQLSVYLGRGEA